ncbi:hypothetical protein [Paraburkholderia fynbosensis]|nr:hypothetical protein [Paraburkholderia fynbosensis]
MSGSHVVQRLFRLRADRVPFGHGCFSQPERGVTPALDLREFRKHCSKSCLLVVKLAAKAPVQIGEASRLSSGFD